MSVAYCISLLDFFFFQSCQSCLSTFNVYVLQYVSVNQFSQFSVQQASKNTVYVSLWHGCICGFCSLNCVSKCLV
jgi:hypothetical protein